ncbi:hypothetical protein ACFE04_004492 [Oxalis oulophora]
MQPVSCLIFFLLLLTRGGVIFYYDIEKKIYIQDTLSMRNVVDERVGVYLWKTYTEVYDEIMLVGVALRFSSAELGSRVKIYGINCSQWVMAMEACGCHSLVCVPPFIPLILNPTCKSAERLKSKND